MTDDHPNAEDYFNRAQRAEQECAELREENARLREVGNVLADFAEHANDCAIVTHGVWSDPIPCTCAYTDAWKAWAALGENRDD